MRTKDIICICLVILLIYLLIKPTIEGIENRPSTCHSDKPNCCQVRLIKEEGKESNPLSDEPGGGIGIHTINKGDSATADLLGSGWREQEGLGIRWMGDCKAIAVTAVDKSDETLEIRDSYGNNWKTFDFEKNKGGEFDHLKNDVKEIYIQSDPDYPTSQENRCEVKLIREDEDEDGRFKESKPLSDDPSGGIGIYTINKGDSAASRTLGNDWKDQKGVAIKYRGDCKTIAVTDVDDETLIIRDSRGNEWKEKYFNSELKNDVKEIYVQSMGQEPPPSNLENSETSCNLTISDDLEECDNEIWDKLSIRQYGINKMISSLFNERDVSRWANNLIHDKIVMLWENLENKETCMVLINDLPISSDLKTIIRVTNNNEQEISKKKFIEIINLINCCAFEDRRENRPSDCEIQFEENLKNTFDEANRLETQSESTASILLSAIFLFIGPSSMGRLISRGRMINEDNLKLTSMFNFPNDKRYIVEDFDDKYLEDFREDLFRLFNENELSFETFITTRIDINDLLEIIEELIIRVVGSSPEEWREKRNELSRDLIEIGIKEGLVSELMEEITPADGSQRRREWGAAPSLGEARQKIIYPILNEGGFSERISLQELLLIFIEKSGNNQENRHDPENRNCNEINEKYDRIFCRLDEVCNNNPTMCNNQGGQREKIQGMLMENDAEDINLSVEEKMDAINRIIISQISDLKDNRSTKIQNNRSTKIQNSFGSGEELRTDTSSCESGQYLDDTECRNCYHRCIECTGDREEDCLRWIDNEMEKTPITEEYDCHESCLSCDGPGFEDCKTCIDGYRIEDNDGDGSGECIEEGIIKVVQNEVLNILTGE